MTVDRYAFSFLVRRLAGHVNQRKYAARHQHGDRQDRDLYGPGSFILEAVGQSHKAEDAGTEPIKLLVIDIMEKGANNTVLKN